MSLAILKAKIPFLGFEPRWRATEHFIIEVVVITSHALTVAFALGTVVWEKFFSHEVRKVEARKSKASLERKTRMKKWNRAKKAVLLGVRGATGLGGLRFGGLKIGGGKSGSMNAGGKAAEGSAALSIIGALGKGKDSKGAVKGHYK